MKTIKLLSILFIAMTLVNCSKSDDSDDQQGEELYTLIFDQNTANEQGFVSTYPELSVGCQYSAITTDPVQGDDGAVLQGAALILPHGFVVDEASFTLDESFFDGDTHAFASVIIVIDNVQFTAISGSVNVTDYTDRRNEGGDATLSGNASLTIQSDDGTVTRTVNVTFTNIVYDFFGSC